MSSRTHEGVVGMLVTLFIIVVILSLAIGAARDRLTAIEERIETLEKAG